VRGQSSYPRQSPARHGSRCSPLGRPALVSGLLHGVACLGLLSWASLRDPAQPADNGGTIAVEWQALAGPADAGTVEAAQTETEIPHASTQALPGSAHDAATAEATEVAAPVPTHDIPVPEVAVPLDAMPADKAAPVPAPDVPAPIAQSAPVPPDASAPAIPVQTVPTEDATLPADIPADQPPITSAPPVAKPQPPAAAAAATASTARPAPARTIPAAGAAPAPSPRKSGVQLTATRVTTSHRSPGAGSAEGQAPAAGNPTPQPDPAPPVVHAVRYRHPPQPPSYPVRAVDMGWTGTVIMRALVTTSGETRQVLVHRSSGYPALDAAALAAVRHWAFEPASIGGRRIEAWVEVPVNFRLN